MSDSFRLVALDAERFHALFDKTDAELAAMGARRMIVDDKPGFPCRVSLADGEVGEAVILLSYLHHDVPGPYRAASPIFVRKGVATAHPGIGEIPAMFRDRLLSLRAYDAEGMLLASDVVQGSELGQAIQRFFADPATTYQHIHNAKPGCYNCRVERA